MLFIHIIQDMVDKWKLIMKQFVNIKIDGLFLRRPISVYDVGNDTLTIVYKVVGEGTEKLKEMKKGEELDILTCLGNGYDLNFDENHALLIGGGVGVPPLYYLAKCLLKQGKKVSAILGFNTKNEVFGENEFKELGIEYKFHEAIKKDKEKQKVK